MLMSRRLTLCSVGYEATVTRIPALTQFPQAVGIRRNDIVPREVHCHELVIGDDMRPLISFTTLVPIAYQ